MSSEHISMLRNALRVAITALTLCVSMSAWSGTDWKEEALLHDGTKIIVERSVERGGRHEIGQKGAYIKQSMAFTLPATGERVRWDDVFTEDLGSASFLPMALDVSAGVAYLIAKPMGCLSYNKWERPNPPYVVFKYLAKEWKRIPLQELPAAIKTPNLIASAPDIEVEKSGKNYFTVEMIQAFTASYDYAVYKTIMREPLPNGGSGCIKTDYYGKAGWLSPDWFADQPSLEACLKFCDFKKIGTETCPCNSLFKGK